MLPSAPSLTLDPPPQKSPAQSFLLPRITYCPDNALCISEAIKLPRFFSASPSSLSLCLPPSSSTYRYDCASGNSGKVPMGVLRCRWLGQRSIFALYRVICFVIIMPTEFRVILSMRIFEKRIGFHCENYNLLSNVLL